MCVKSEVADYSHCRRRPVALHHTVARLRRLESPDGLRALLE